MSDEETSLGGSGASFRTTRWTILGHRKLDELIQLYWKPVYVYLRRKGHGIEDAKDFTQSFFTKFLEKDYASQADRSRGRFRNFLRACVDHFVSNELDRARAQKRGGGNVLSLDLESAERLLSNDDPPDRQFNTQWAQAILDESLAELAREYEKRGQSEKFAEIRPFLSAGNCEDRSALHRARRRLGALIRRRVAETLDNPQNLEEELNFLFESVRQTPKEPS